MNDHSRTDLDDFFTRFVDTDEHWGPLLFLRPRVNQSLSSARVLALSVLLGVAFGLLGSILLALVARAADRPAIDVRVFPLTLTALYFVLCRATFVPAWNRRAQKLARRDRV
ncbi:MAG TPA: hypothetical protein VHV51_08005 [Polyangiaceae bacterium]|jgi:hypothetical protein|nr:hypothetical protein [Polyangiaceae bacterium]